MQTCLPAAEDGSEEDDSEADAESSDEEAIGGGGSDADDEQGEAAAGAGALRAAREVRQRNSQLKSEVARHKEELERLRERDPEFYNYLQVRRGRDLNSVGSL